MPEKRKIWAELTTSGRELIVHIPIQLVIEPYNDRDIRAERLASLSPRERVVYKALRDGQANKEIAALLGVSVRTAKFHVSAIFSKLGLRNRAEALLYGELK